MRLNKIIGYGTFLLLAVTIGLTALQLNSKSFAGTYGLAQYQAYYNKQPYTAVNERFVLTDGIPMDWNTNPQSTTVDKFLAQVHDYLYNTGVNAVWHQQEGNDARAAGYILTMMGVQSNDPRLTADPALAPWQNGIVLAKKLEASWATIVRQYDAGTIPGASVKWNETIASTDKELNGSGIALCNGGTCNEAVDRGAVRQEVPDFMFVQADNETRDAIIFYHSNGTTYTIKKWCGNMIGDEQPFPSNWTHVPQIDYTTPPGNLAVTGNPIVLNFSGTAQNTGPAPSAGGVLSGIVQKNSDPIQVLNQSAFGPLASGATTAPPLLFSFTVPAFTPPGTQFCFFTMVTPANISGADATTTGICYTVSYASWPGLLGLNGDIHAGGGICGGATSTGNVTGNTNAGSMGEYVVASSGLTSNFRSNGTGARNDLLLGNTGGYAKACRPNLLQAALNGRTAGSAVITNPTVDLKDITGIGMPDVYYFPGPTLHLSGTARSKVTIVATAGSIIIDGPILLDNTPAAAKYVPSVGIIAQGDIVIDPVVTRVDAYLFSNSTIDTCDPGAVAKSTTCSTPQLVVNGFLMGRNILFNRLGLPNSSGAQISEKIVLTPQLYLNPPRFFDDASTTVLQAQGEKPPLY